MLVGTKLTRTSPSDSSFRAGKLIQEFIADLSLNLSDLVVLTEAASGNYVFTPIIAAKAGAAGVLAIARDSRYGSARTVAENTLSLARLFGVEREIQISSTIRPEIIKQADIVTNLGSVRPIDRDFLSKMKNSAVVALMYETWEFRERDLDLTECWRRGIPVLGTNEEHEALRIFDYVGHLCLKRLYEANVEVFRSKIVLVGDNRFGKNIVKTLSAVGARVLCVTKTERQEIARLGGRKIGNSLKETSAQNEIEDSDAMIINTYPDLTTVIGENGDLSGEKLKKLAPSVMIIQLNGRVQRESLLEHGIACLPLEEPSLGHMGWTLADLGPKPVIALNSGGLKVGELLAKARLKGLNHPFAEDDALKDVICQDFSQEQRKKYEP